MGQRIIGGRLKGKKLFSIQGNLIRPTGNRQRESIFNILSDRIRETAVLDLFAGTGALGLEALSRGAKTCIFIDVHRSAIQIIERNIRACRLEDSTRIIGWNVAKNLRCLNTLGISFDIVFMDPPYNRGLIAPALQNLHAGGNMKAGSTVVVEHAPDDEIPETGDAFTCYDQRRYGKTLVSFLNYMILFIVVGIGLNGYP
jgi:16S rRNA (guanine966-N2)-methyltransferase